MRSTYSTAAAALSLLGGASAQTNASLPTVDLGYLVQRAIAVNVCGPSFALASSSYHIYLY